MKRNNEEIKKLVKEVRMIGKLLYLQFAVSLSSGTPSPPGLRIRKQKAKDKLKEMFKNRNLI